MREIKFRAWHKEKKIMGEVLGIDILHKEIFFSNEDVDCYEHTDFKDIELMQYTGLKDKNNKEIYEGDIFHIGSKKILYVVEWIDCGLKGRQIKNKSWIGLDYWKDDIEVIGNIYENPELLEENNN